jgi:ESX secretion system protein EccE
VTTPLAAGTLAAAPLSLIGAGLVIGEDRRGELVVIRVFRPEPTAITVIGGSWLAQILVFRALALGATVSVDAPYAPQWQALPQVRPHHRGAGGPSARHPRLLVSNEDTDGGASGAWRTRLALLPRLDHASAYLPDRADLTVVQRLSASEAATLATVLPATEQTLHLLQSMSDDMVAIIGGGADRYVWVNPTGIEQSLFGPARRDRG